MAFFIFLHRTYVIILKYIIGIDFGHEKTAAWAVPVETTIWDDGFPLQITSVSDIHDTERYTRPSVIFKDTNSNYSLYETWDFPLKKYFKGKYKIEDIESNSSATDFSNYIRLIVQAFLNNENNKLAIENNCPNFQIFIGCPSLWRKGEREKYRQFVNYSLRDLGVQVDGVVDVSDAAIFRFYSSVKESCALVIDFGTSTIDYTLMIDGIKVSDDTWSNHQLGTSNIERNMYQHFINDEKIGGELQKYKQKLIDAGEFELAKNIPDDLMYSCREAKEESFAWNFYDINNGRMKSILFRDSIILAGNLKEMMGDYPEQVRREFNRLRTRVFGELKRRGQNKLDLVILSGGAFIMKWLVNMAKDVFKNSEVKKDPYPSYVVAKGIALYARMQYQ